MSGTFFGINVAESGLAAQRRAMDVLGYNIANANDPTYKRQRLVLTEGQFLAQSQEANPIGSSAFGSGVNSGDIERIRDPLIENRLRQAMTASANWTTGSPRCLSSNPLSASRATPACRTTWTTSGTPGRKWPPSPTPCRPEVAFSKMRTLFASV